MEDLQLINVTSENVDEYGLGCLENRKHPGFALKKKWMENQRGNGLGIKILKKDNKTTGFVEFIDGEYAWRGVTGGRLFIYTLYMGL